MIASSSASDDAHGLGHRSLGSPGTGLGRRARPPCGRAASSCSCSSSRDRPAQRVALAALGVGVAARLVRLGVGERRLGHERPQAGVLGFGLEERALLVGDRELGAQPLEPVAHVDQAALEQGPGHEAEQSTSGRTRHDVAACVRR